MEEQSEASALFDTSCHENVQERDKCCYLNRSQVYRKSIWVRQNIISIYIVLIYLDVRYNKSGLFHDNFTPINLCFLDSFSY